MQFNEVQPTPPYAETARMIRSALERPITLAAVPYHGGVGCASRDAKQKPDESAPLIGRAPGAISRIPLAQRLDGGAGRTPLLPSFGAPVDPTPRASRL